MTNPFENKKITYPCRWFCRIITTNSASLEQELNQALCAAGYAQLCVTSKNKSEGNKYASFELTTILTKEGEMDQIVNTLKAVPGVKLVI